MTIRLPALRSWYVIAANTALLFFLLQIGAWVSMWVFDWTRSTLLRPPLPDAVRQNYAHMAPADLQELLRATYQLQYRYVDVVGVIQAEVASRFINVDGHGIRSNGEGVRDISAIEGAIWFFGGSTAFGFGVADHETIPAQLERLLGRPVINFGVPAFASTHENLLFNHYLQIGYRPAAAVFLNGVNESCESYEYSDEMQTVFERAQSGYYAWDLGGPLLIGFQRVVGRLKRLGEEVERQSIACTSDGKKFPLAAIVTRLLGERNAVCQLYSVDCWTMVQPMAAVHGRRDGFGAEFLAIWSEDSRALFAHLEPVWRSAGAVFLTDAFDGYARHPFIDEAHYSADASRLIAELIARRVQFTNRQPSP